MLCRYLERQLKDLPTKNAMLYIKILALVIESGAIYSSALIIEITLYFINTNAFYIVYDPIAQLTVNPNSPLIHIIVMLTSRGIPIGHRTNHDHRNHHPWSYDE